MATASDIVRRALRKIGVVSNDEPVNANDMAEGIDALNMMIHGWKLHGADVTHTTLAASDTFALAPEYEEGTVYLLADRLSTDYEIPKTFDPEWFFEAIQAANMTIAVASFDLALTRMPSKYLPGTDSANADDH